MGFAFAGNLGIGMRWIVVPMLYTGLIGALIMVPFCLCGGSIGLGFGPLLRFSLSADRKKNEQTILQPPARTPVEYIREVHFSVVIYIVKFYRNQIEA